MATTNKVPNKPRDPVKDKPSEDVDVPDRVYPGYGTLGTGPRKQGQTDEKTNPDQAGRDRVGTADDKEE